MKTRIIALSLLVVLMLASAITVSAQGPGQGQAPGQGQPGQQGQGQPPQGQQPGQQGQPPQGQQGQPGQGGNWSGVVQTITSSSLTAARTDNTTFTATISSTTRIESMLTQSTMAVTDIVVGNNVVIEGRRVSDTSVAAQRILVEPSGTRVQGTVSAISGATITLARENATTTIVTTSSTQFYKGKTVGSLSDVTKGAMVIAYGIKQSDGSLSATYVVVNGGQGQGQPPEQPTRSGTPPVQGTPPAQATRPAQPQPQPNQSNWNGIVQSVASASLTVLRANNATFTATISSTTKIESILTQNTIALSDIVAGNNVNIEGRRVSDTNIAAQRIIVEPSGAKTSGLVNAVAGTTITLAAQKDSTTSVITTSSTQFYKNKTTGSLADVVKGVNVIAYGSKQSDGSFLTTYVIVNGAPNGASNPGQVTQVSQGGRSTTGQGQDVDQPIETPQNNNVFDQFINWLRDRFKSR